MSKGLFIAGTDTEAGKSTVSAALVLALRARGLDVGYFKPVGTEAVDTGFGPINPDALMVRGLAGLEDDPAVMNPVCLQHPLSPLAASRLENEPISREMVRSKFAAGLAGHGFTLCEGAGGLLVPVAEDYTVLGMAVDLGFPVLLVARPGLGTINHTILSLDALRRAGLKPAGFCFSGPEPESGVKGTRNSELITEFCGETFLGCLPLVIKTAEGSLRPGDLAQAGEALDLDRLIRIMEG